ncbi:molybdenum cofactor biosynthesis protein MoaE [bacterium]|nr:molybdenum cofactor biosynthesis protein MoaE [bacterium]
MDIKNTSKRLPLINLVIQASPFDIPAETRLLETALLKCASADNRSAIGALATFTGSVRGSEIDAASTADMAAYGELLALDIEHYPAMTQSTIEAIALKAAQRWSFLACSVIHRVGRLPVGEPIVLVLVASSHRKEAFAVCEYILDYLKTAAPFWKKAIFEHGEQWVAAKVSDTDALDKWTRPAP